MALVINTNTSSLGARNQLALSERALATSMERLTSGKRINSAADDAAGLSVANLLTSQIREKSRAILNANDGISLIQVADSSLETVTDSIQRLRELAIQATNGTNSVANRAVMQFEAEQILDSIDLITEQTTFNGQKLFEPESIDQLDTDKRAVLEGLNSYWISEAEDFIRTYYGLSGSGNITVNLDFSDGAGGVAASVSWTQATVPEGFATDLTLNIDMADFSPANLPNGGTEPFYNDRIIAHEMVHAVMASNMDLNAPQVDGGAALPGWFTEGAAEFIHGADERVASDLLRSGGATAIKDALPIAPGSPSDSRGYSAAYVAVKMIHEDMLAVSGGTVGIDYVMQHLAASRTNNLTSAFMAFEADYGSPGYNSQASFEALFDNKAVDFINGTYNNATSGASGGLNLSDADTGSIAGSDYAGSTLTAESVLPNDPASGLANDFAMISPDLGAPVTGRTITFALGALAEDRITLVTSGADTAVLGIDGIDLVENSTGALTALDQALEQINSLRANFGAVENRLGFGIEFLHKSLVLNSEARSRVEDADMAREAAHQARNQILQEVATAMLAQANAEPQLVLSLLR